MYSTSTCMLYCMEERIGVFISNAFQNFGDTTTRGACNKQHTTNAH